MKLKFLTIISILSYYLLALSCSESPVPLSEVPQLMNVPEACVDLPLRHQALEQAKVEIEGAMSKLGVKAQPPSYSSKAGSWPWYINLITGWRVRRGPCRSPARWSLRS